MAAAAELPTPATVSFITSLNETIDLHTKRMAEGSNHIPGAVELMLLIVAGSGVWSSGVNSGSFEGRSAFSPIGFPVLIAIVITLNADIDSPREGLIGLSQKPMEELLASM